MVVLRKKWMWTLCVSCHVLLGLIITTHADLNLYLNETEAKRILGIGGELYYVRDNIVNEQAVSFNVPISSSIETLFFTWQNVHSTQPMWYNRSISVSSEEAMFLPKTSLPKEGIAPQKLSAFWVELQCTGHVTRKVRIYITLYIALFIDTGPRKLTIGRTKLCLADGTADGSHGVLSDDSSEDTHDVQSEWMSDRIYSASAVVFYMVLTALLCLLLLLVVIALACHNSKENQSHSDTASVALIHAEGCTDGPYSDTPNVVQDLYSHSPYVQVTSQQLEPTIRAIHIDRSCIVLGETLMEGSFGKVYRGTLIVELKDSVQNSMDVCVKTVTEAVSSTQMQVFLRECCLLKGQLHANVNPLIATCLEEEEQPLMVFPYLCEGNLKRFLLASKLSDRGTKQALSTQQLVCISIQLVRGVEYLHKHGLVHSDIATRNCLVDSQLVVRLGDNALSRDLFPADYHCLGDNENRPIKWLSIEALLDNTYSYASDVWAFGVTVWEVMTFAQQPYADVDAFEMDTYLREGYRVSQPPNCPDELFAVMACCWSLVADERPHVAHLCTCLQDFYSALCQFI